VTNSYFEYPDSITRNTLGRADAMASIFESLEDGFDKLPDPTALRYMAHMLLTDTSETANVITADFATAPSAYTEIPVLFVIAANAPTAASTIDINSLGSVQVRRFDDSVILADDWAAGSLLVLIRHSSGRYRLSSVHGADVTATAADAVATAADAVQTALDVIATAADVVSTGDDATATAADAVQTALDRIATAADAVSTDADATATAADAIATAADVVAAAASATTAAGIFGNAGIQYSVIDRGLTAPPGSPTEGDIYIPAATATGAWATHENEIAIYVSSAWVFTVPQEGWVAWINDEDKQVKWNTTIWEDWEDQATHTGASPTFAGLTVGGDDIFQPSPSNILINGDFSQWQRGTSFTGTAFFAYAADRWMNFYAGNMTISRVAGDKATYAMRVQRTAGQTDLSPLWTSQSARSVNSKAYAGKTVTLQFRGRRGADFSAASNFLHARISTGTGTDENRLSAGYTGGVDVGINQVLTTSWQDFEQTLTLPANTNEIEVAFVATPTGTAGADDSYEIENVQLAQAPGATEFIPLLVEETSALCETYNRKISYDTTNYSVIGDGQAISTTVAEISLPLTPEMRGIPTLAKSTVSQFSLTDASGASLTVTGISINVFTKNTASLTVTVASGLVAGNATQLTFNTTTTAYIELSSEL